MFEFICFCLLLFPSITGVAKLLLTVLFTKTKIKIFFIKYGYRVQIKKQKKLIN